MRTDVWGDGGNWARGHWLNGRAGLSTLAATVSDLCARAGVIHIDVSGLDGVLEGYLIDAPMALRGALEPLRLAYGFQVIERDGVLVFEMETGAGRHDLDAMAFVEPGAEITTRLIDKAPQRLRLTYLDAARDYAPALAEARTDGGDPRLVSDLALPIVLNETRAQAIASRLLDLRRLAHTAQIGLPASSLALEPGDRVNWQSGKHWRVDGLTVSSFEQQVALSEDVSALGAWRLLGPGRVPQPASIRPEPDLVILDAPDFSGDPTAQGPFVAAFADPWPGDLGIRAGVSMETLTSRVTLETPARIARLRAPVGAGPHGRFDRVNVLDVTLPVDGYESVTQSALFNGANAAWLETLTGWECIQFQTAELTGVGQWRLTGLLRAQAGTISAPCFVGARLVLIDESAKRANVARSEWSSDLVWRADGAETVVLNAFENTNGLPWPVAHLRRHGSRLSWTRRGPDLPESWALPEAPAEGLFEIRYDFGSGFAAPVQQTAASALIPAGAQRVRVAAIGADSRAGAGRELSLV
jgi:hypothetical protein